MSSAIEAWVAADTVLSEVDGEAGRLVLRGFDLEALVGQKNYEGVVEILWADVVPDEATPMSPQTLALGQARVDSFLHLAPLLDTLERSDVSNVMRSLLAAPYPKHLNTPRGLLASVGVAAALATRHHLGLALIEPHPQCDHAADLLRLLTGGQGSIEQVAALDTYMISAIDHGLNASTFTARVVASTNATTQNAVVAAFAALTGPLHGGAPGPVLDMLDLVGDPKSAPAWIESELAAGRRLMGFGHRIYRVRDPRADVLKTALQRLEPGSGRMGLAEAVESAALQILNGKGRTKRLDTNTEFYTALLLEALGIPRASFTPVFAAARAAGWIAHVAEQRSLGRLIRPQSNYIGPRPPLKAA